MHLNKNLLLLHFTVFIWGFTAILGALISLTAYELVWYRMLIAFLSLLIYFKIRKGNFSIDRKTALKWLAIGGVVALHWFFFYHSIKTSTISVALVCLSSTALFISFLNPFFGHTKKLSLIDLGTSVLIIGGICLIFHFETRYTQGIIYGLVCAFMAAVFTLLNEKEVKKHDPILIGLYEMLGGFLCISAYLLFTFKSAHYQLSINASDFIYLFLLGTICTAFAYVTGIVVMKELSAFSVVLTTNLEPVYGILMAFLFFGSKEKMTSGFYAGALIILAAVFLYPIVKRKVIKT